MKMKNRLQNIRKILRKTTKYFFDFLVVFIGVFLAFWLEERKNTQNEEAQERQIYQAIYEDLKLFYIDGREENDEGFINLFKNSKKKLDSLVTIKQIPSTFRLYGDYWHLEIINSLVKGGDLLNLDVRVFKGLARANTLHLQFLDEIEGFNRDYENYITADYGNTIDSFYKEDTTILKEKYQLPFHRLDRIITLSKMLVDIAENSKNQLNMEFNFEEVQQN
jgi:hypothetical protein